MARAGAPSAFHVGIYGPTIIHHGTALQQERFLRQMLTGAEVWCQLYSEPNAGSDLASLKTRAEDKGDHYEINGQKVWTSTGTADWGLLLARTDATAAKHQGISCFLIDMHQPGVEVRRLKQMTGTPSSARCSSTMRAWKKSTWLARSIRAGGSHRRRSASSAARARSTV